MMSNLISDSSDCTDEDDRDVLHKEEKESEIKTSVNTHIVHDDPAFY